MTVWVLDLDGVIWLAEQPVPGSSDAVAQLRARGDDVVFVTNNSNLTRAAYQEKLAAHGIADATVVSSATVAAGLVDPGERVLVAAGPGVREALRDRGAVVVEDTTADVVMVGFHRDFDYERLRVASTAVLGGARILATNDDPTYPTPDGPIPGTGAILAALERATGVRAMVAGKPNPPMADHLRARFGPDGIVVGDRLDTDGGLAESLGYRFVLVLTGVTSGAQAAAAGVPIALVAGDLAEAVQSL
jgi:HAD superfamily hydrolase (TIGR01450 family)